MHPAVPTAMPFCRSVRQAAYQLPLSGPLALFASPPTANQAAFEGFVLAGKVLASFWQRSTGFLNFNKNTRD